MGDRNRIVKEFYDPEVLKLLRTDPVKLRCKLKADHIRPAYQYTKAEVGGLECHTEPMTR